ncbi:hypothetical protein CROQUDRAFT_672049 [Cronartium quercuum f. sp. fusiforme G11]|uniref:Uncharacterized protein n=1 Tax=Cronartium quercuum f. sp. fusiforme G11 TaxID=708437 RepID=A0A9P6TAA9_9BASI|nr:hypothetical protein CROQUDRAFT_672049 [Cronartium quercuum f. sp. fusiforme G11]
MSSNSTSPALNPILQLTPSPASLSSSSHSTTCSLKRSRHTDKARLKVLSTNLQLRLNYAKLKVSHGWHTHTLNQVENLYSIQRRRTQPARRSSSSTGSSDFTPSSSQSPVTHLSRLSHLSQKSPNLPSTLTLNDLQRTLSYPKLTQNPTPHDRPTSQPSGSNPTSRSDLDQPLTLFNPLTDLTPARPVEHHSHAFFNPTSRPSPRLIGTPARLAAFPETPNPFRAAAERRTSNGLMNIFPSMPGSARSCSEEFWRTCYSPIAFTSAREEQPTPLQSRLSITEGSMKIAPLRFNNNRTSNTTEGRSSSNSIPKTHRNRVFSTPSAGTIEEAPLDISLDDLDRINWS